MPGQSFSIGSQSFGALATPSGDARFALWLIPDVPDYVRLRFHIQGTDGNSIIRGGRQGMPIMAMMRYYGDIINIQGFYNADCTAWMNTAVSITDQTGVTYPNCNIESFKVVPRSIRGVVGSNPPVCFFDAVANFTWDG